MNEHEIVTWLESRRPAPPPALAAHLRRSMINADQPLADHLALLGARALQGVVSRPEGGRELALELLAADAFVTYAFEAQAEADIGALAALAERIARRVEP